MVETGTGRLDLGDKKKDKKISNLDSYFSALISSKNVASPGVRDKHSLDFFYILIYKGLKCENMFDIVSLNDEKPSDMEAASDLGDHLLSSTL